MVRERISKYCYPAVSINGTQRGGSESCGLTFGFSSFSSASAFDFLAATGLGGAAASLFALSSSFWRAFWRFFNSDLETFSPVTSSRCKFATASVGGADPDAWSAMVIFCVLFVLGECLWCRGTILLNLGGVDSEAVTLSAGEFSSPPTSPHRYPSHTSGLFSLPASLSHAQSYYFLDSQSSAKSQTSKFPILSTSIALQFQCA
jgi:hypothetical protein